MNTCNNCQKKFKTSVVIDGKRKVLNHRKFCLECSPWGRHNTRPDISLGTTILGSSSRPYKEWSEEKKIRGRANQHFHRIKRLTNLINLSGGCCTKCGYRKCYQALEFHHRDPTQKQFELSSAKVLQNNWDDVLKEHAKCDLLCANCHRELHAMENKSKYAAYTEERMSKI